MNRNLEHWKFLSSTTEVRSFFPRLPQAPHPRYSYRLHPNVVHDTFPPSWINTQPPLSQKITPFFLPKPATPSLPSASPPPSLRRRHPLPLRLGRRRRHRRPRKSRRETKLLCPLRRVRRRVHLQLPHVSLLEHVEAFQALRCRE